jgi:hypothetical protein
MINNYRLHFLLQFWTMPSTERVAKKKVKMMETTRVKSLKRVAIATMIVVMKVIVPERIMK